MRVTIELPQVGRRRAIFTGVLASSATALWIAAPVYVPEIPLLPDATVSPMHVLTGFVCPFGLGWVALLVMERRIKRDHKRVRRQVEPEPVLRRHLVEGEVVR